MPGSLVLGNGSLLINFDDNVNLKDIYYPHPGQLNHLAGRRCQFALWSAGGFSVLRQPDWTINCTYRKGTMVGETEMVSHKMEIKMRITDIVHYCETIYLRKIHLTNLQPVAREIRLFWTENLAAGGTELGNSCLYLPDLGAVYHYRGPYCFLFGGSAGTAGASQFACGIREMGDKCPVTARDAGDGFLSGRAVADGIVDSTIGFNLDLPAGGEADVYFWMVAGASLAEIKKGQHLIVSTGPEQLIRETASYWSEWCRRSEPDMADLPPEIGELYQRSLFLIRTQMDNDGAILAGNDSDIYETNPDAYSYLWPRDGALVANCLDRAGYFELAATFFRFAARILSPEGYFLQRYNPDGTPGSTWHPRWKNGAMQLPIQEDETALMLWALWEHYGLARDLELVREVYPDLVRPASRFLSSYLDSSTGLPLPSYDLWEERRGIFTFTVCAVIAGLRAAAGFAAMFGEQEDASLFSQQAGRMTQALEEILYDPERGRFLRGCYPDAPGEYVADVNLDSSLFALFAFGVLAADDPRVQRTMEAVRDGLWVKTPVGGLARYPGDYYFRSSSAANVPGNPWIITTLWLADWYTAAARDGAGLRQARDLILWAADKASPAGFLAEQVHPETGQPLSVIPLTWSHATFVSSVLNYLEKYRQLRSKLPASPAHPEPARPLAETPDITGRSGPT